MERVFDLEAVLAEVRRALEAGRIDEAVRLLSDQRPADLVEVFEELEDEEQIDLLPRLATRLHIDPALVSNPLMSTVVDATGLLIYLQIAKAILGI